MAALRCDMGLWLILAGPLVGAVLAGVAALARRFEKAAPAVTLAATALAGVAALANRPSRSAGYLGHAELEWLTIGDGLRITMGVHLDHLAWVMVGVVVAVSFLVQLYSIGYMKGDTGYARYFAYLSLFTGSMLGLVLADNLIQLYACWELVGICSYLLIGFWWGKPSAAAAAKKAFVVTRFGDVGFLLGVILLAVAAGSFDLGDVRTAFQSVASGAQRGSPLMSNEVFVWLVPLLLLCGAIGKSAQFPLHIWLPDAMEGPTPVSALIHAATMVAAGVYMVARLIWMFTWSSAEAALAGTSPTGSAAVPLDAVLLVGATTAFIGATTALVQFDIKKVLAYSTISQLGFMMMALGAGGDSGSSTAMFHLVTHAFFKALLFLAAGSVIHAMHHAADPNDMRGMGGLAHRMPVTAWTSAIGVLALSGLPPLAGFWSKDAVIGLLLHGSGTSVFGIAGRAGARVGPDAWVAGVGACVALAVTVLTALYPVRLWLLVFAGTPRSRDAETATESPASMTLPLVVLAVPSAAVGWWLHRHHLLHAYLTGSAAGAELKMHVGVATMATLLGLAGAAAAWTWHCRRPTTTQTAARPAGALLALPVNLWFVDRFWTWIGARLAMGTARAIAWFDRHVVDGAVRGSARLVAGLGTAMCRSASGQTQTYAAVVIGGAVALMLLLALYETAAGPAARDIATTIVSAGTR